MVAMAARVPRTRPVFGTNASTILSRRVPNPDRIGRICQGICHVAAEEFGAGLRARECAATATTSDRDTSPIAGLLVKYAALEAAVIQVIQSKAVVISLFAFMPCIILS